VISSQAASAAFRGQAPHLLANYGTDISQIRSGALKESIRSGDIVIDKIVRDAARHIGIAVANIINLLAPDVVVLGGGMVEAMPELFVTEIKKVARARVLPTFANSFDVVAAELGDLASVLGAAAWADHNADLSRS
jgi:glucokinase